MNLNPPEPRLNKLPFIITATVCFLVVVLIGLFAPNKFETLPLLVSVVFLITSISALMIPALADYAADCREATTRLSQELEQQIVRVQTAGESLVRAAAQIKAIEEAVQKSAHDAETLPYRMAEKLAEFNEALALQENEDREALERELEELRSVNSGNLKSVATQIQKATADWTALEAATRKQITHAQEIAAKIGAMQPPAPTKIESTSAPEQPQPTPAPAPVEAKKATPPPTVTPQPKAEPPAPTTPAPAPLVVESVSVTEPAKSKKARPPRKTRPEDTLLAMSEPAGETESAEDAESDPSEAHDQDFSNGHSASTESSSSSDGATRLLTTAYIGIGNKLFIRGDGPGLSWDRGVPMQFVSIGKWGWATHDATGSVRVKLFKNDETAALSGELTLEPGRHTEVTALF